VQHREDFASPACSTNFLAELLVMSTGTTVAVMTTPDPSKPQSLFDSILSEAATVATLPVPVNSDSDRPEFRDFSDRQEPSAGFLPQAITPATLQPHGYQWAAVESALLFRRTVVGFEPGMGKTLIAMTVTANLVAEGRKVVVVVPPTLRIDPWERGFAAQYPDLRVKLVSGRKANPLKPATLIDPDADVVIIGDSVLAARVEDIIEWGATGFVVDEAQRMKSSGTGRSKGMMRLVDEAEVAHRVAPDTNPEPTVLMLTGTLSMNSPDECYQPIRIAGRKLVTKMSGADSRESFVKRWCVQSQFRVKGGGMKFKTVGCTDPEGMHERLREVCYLRTRREDVLDMPTKVWAVRGLDLGTEAMREYNRIADNFIDWVMEQNGAEAAARASKAEAMQRMMKLWAIAGTAKAEAAAEYVAGLVEQGEQVVVMMEHRPAVEAFHDAIRQYKVRDGIRTRPIRTVEVIGGMGERRKVEAQDVFRDGKCEVLIGSLKAAAEGLNLDNAEHLVFLQLPWSPGLMVQASDRIYRMTVDAKELRTIHVLNALDTVDERMYLQLQAKAAVTDMLNSGERGVAVPQHLTVKGEVLASFGWLDDYS
jgi:SNF2 family DNA or RNA helicase